MSSPFADNDFCMPLYPKCRLLVEESCIANEVLPFKPIFQEQAMYEPTDLPHWLFIRSRALGLSSEVSTVRHGKGKEGRPAVYLASHLLPSLGLPAVDKPNHTRLLIHSRVRFVGTSSTDLWLNAH